MYHVLKRSHLNILKKRGVESLYPNSVRLPAATKLETPCSLKWLQVEHHLNLGAFSYAVSGYAGGVSIGRYCSIGENVQIGRQNHPIDWMSTHPVFYFNQPMFNVETDFSESRNFHSYRSHLFGRVPATKLQPTVIENDVWIGQSALINAGVKIGTGAVIAGGSVVTKDVPPYAIMGGNPARIIRMRFDEQLSEKLLQSQWWKFAPWQFGHINFNRPEEIIDELLELADTTPPFKPDEIHVGDFMKEFGI